MHKKQNCKELTIGEELWIIRAGRFWRDLKITNFAKK